MEARSRSSSQSSDVFTRNPQDKFQTPVPPKPLPSPRLGDLCTETYTVPMIPTRADLRSVTPASSEASRGSKQHSRSQSSTSPQHSRGAMFTEFRGLKERLGTSKKSPTTSPRQLQIGVPTLISTTAEDVTLVPLARTSASLRGPRTPSSDPNPSTASRLRQFSPLGSHPVEPLQSSEFGFAKRAPNENLWRSKHSRSRATSIETATEVRIITTRARANSVDTTRTRHCLTSSEPWVSNPKLNQVFDKDIRPAPVLQRSSASLQPPTADSRPSSSHGGDRSPSLRRSPLDKDKDLPPLPRYLVPAPLFACNSAAPSPVLPHYEEQGLDSEPESKEDVVIRVVTENRSHFSTWSADSSTFSCIATNEDIVHSPTFSSLTSDSSDINESPQQISDPFTHGDQTYTFSEKDVEDESSLPSLSSSPPKLELNPLHISTFGTNLLNLNIRRSGEMSHRQASCFGFGFQGYSLPEDETESQATITKVTSHEEPAIANGRGSSVSHIERLMNEFGYLGESVL